MQRLTDHPVLGPRGGQPISFEFDGIVYPALEGDSVASALLASGVRTLRRSKRADERRGIYCGIGHCYECRVTVDGKASVRACITPVADGMVVELGPSPAETRP
ncbi:(2Fe-2S)-binding protein [Arthrobacter sp. USHLN218]|uniref:(2Fe-2S)-binding protein n=1 Tax=Arthrobacter sp. USHLN218 TaxID=3081232 RepID=UPI003018D2D4